MEIVNRKARYDYEIIETYETGIVLTGTEIKSIRNGKCNIKDSYGIIRNGEVFVINMFISSYEEGNRFNHIETRTRKLLLHSKEINKLKSYVDLDGYTLVPLKIYFKNNYAKVLLGVGRGKKNYEKRETIKKRDLDRQLKKMNKY